MAIASARTSINLNKTRYSTDHGSPRHEKYTLADELPTQLSELALRPRAMSKLHPEYTLRRLSSNDRDQVLKFLRRFFFLDEPMNQAIGLLETPDSRCIELEDYAASSLKDGISIAAVDDEGDLVGVVLNGIATREESAHFKDKSDSCPNAKFRRILKVLAHLELEGRPWDKLPSSCHTIMEVRIVSTHSAWRGKGLMRVLCEESERLAFEMGATAMRLDATSAFSAAAAERLGYKRAYSVRYAELPYAPQPEPPHLEARTYLKELYN